ncbi:MAG TPA: gephyrin-like molybdotransferase Glp [Acidimicrobiales bacterium]|nr:gephyrin-like molybdotransferase Glp [Acidimicrobiales bacterium]
MISLSEAQDWVLRWLSPLAPVEVGLDGALGCVSASALAAAGPVPPFANTAMDGFALRSADTAGAPVELRVVGILPAGADPTGMRVGAGEAVRIMTGAPIPEGADAVVMVERTRGGEAVGDTVTVEVEAPAGNHVRGAGEDLAAGQEIFPAGTRLGPAHLGLLASAGLDRVAVHPRPRVGVLSTGDELVEAPAELRPGQIRDSNRRALLALVRQCGCEAVDLGLARDDEAVIADVLAAGARRCDAVLTSGGVSVGDFDYVLVVLEKLGERSRWMQVAIKPAKPLAFGIVEGAPVFGLPGNPASSMVSFELFARPALRLLAGHPTPRPQPVAAVAADDLRRRPDGKLHLVRSVVEVDPAGRLTVRSAGGQGSNLLRSMAAANALALVPDGDGIASGGPVQVLLLGDDGALAPSGP